MFQNDGRNAPRRVAATIPARSGLPPTRPPDRLILVDGVNPGFLRTRAPCFEPSPSNCPKGQRRQVQPAEPTAYLVPKIRSIMAVSEKFSARTTFPSRKVY